MRKVALVPAEDSDVRRVILHTSEEGAFLYLSREVEDRGAFADEWYRTVEEAEAVCQERHGIGLDMWETVPDPQPGCLADWIAPVRVVGSATGRPQWGRLERREGSGWVPVEH
jgi:hypothetical protein